MSEINDKLADGLRENFDSGLLEKWLTNRKDQLRKTLFAENFNSIPMLKDFELKENNHDEIIQEYAKNVASWNIENVKKIKRNDDKIENDFARDSVEKMVSEENMCYMGSCHGSTLLSIEMLKKSGINSELIIVPIYDNLKKRSTYHFALKFKYKDQDYFFDFLGANTIIVGKGEYRNMHTNPIIADENKRSELLSEPIIINSDKINSSQSIANIMQKEGLANKEMLDKLVSAIKEDNTDEEFEDFQGKVSDYLTSPKTESYDFDKE